MKNEDHHENQPAPVATLAAIALVANGVSAAENDTDTTTSSGMTGDLGKGLAVGISLGFAALAAGLSQASIGSAVIGMIAEDGSKFAQGLIMTVLPESIVILGLLPMFVL